jgi:hypothetical protein
MRFIDYILEDNFVEAKKCFDEMLTDKMSAGLKEEKEELEEIFLEDFGLLEAVKRNPNIIKMGRIKKIRRRIRRNAKGRIVVQKNVRRSGVKGYRISGNTVKRIPATERLRKARLLKRSWKTTRRAKLRRSLLKRKLSMRRRTSLGLR